jgi:MYXO-CTERM domain-containing protein
MSMQENCARRLALCAALSVFAVAPMASAVSIDWTLVGDPGNACDTQSQGCFGAVGYAYDIGTYEVTNAQYAEFLNFKAASDPLALYNSSSSIVQSGSSGGYSYSVFPGRDDMPVQYVSVYDAMRFANWLNNGQGSGDTETGAYTLLGGTATPSNGTTVTRNAGATIVLPSEDEWYKAAYYDALSASFFDYPAGSDTQIVCSAPTASANRENCGNAVGDVTIRGSYTGSPSPYGTYDQGGNVYEWNEWISGSFRGMRGGSWANVATDAAASSRPNFTPTVNSAYIGFRVAMVVPEPDTGLLAMVGLLGLAVRRRRG